MEASTREQELRKVFASALAASMRPLTEERWLALFPATLSRPLQTRKLLIHMYNQFVTRLNATITDEWEELVNEFFVGDKLAYLEHDLLAERPMYGHPAVVCPPPAECPPQELARHRAIEYKMDECDRLRDELAQAQAASEAAMHRIAELRTQRSVMNGALRSASGQLRGVSEVAQTHCGAGTPLNQWAAAHGANMSL